MSLSSILVFLLLLMFLVAYASYSLNKAKSHIYCMFIRWDGTWINKWAKPMQDRIDFDKGWYKLNPEMMISKVLDNGIHKLFPTKVDAQIFRFGNPDPLNPFKFEIASLTPEQRKALNKREDIEAYAQGNRTSLQSKQRKGMLESLMPMITLAVFAVMGYMIYILNSRVDQIGFGQNVVQQMLQELLAR